VIIVEGKQGKLSKVLEEIKKFKEDHAIEYTGAEAKVLIIDTFGLKLTEEGLDIITINSTEEFIGMFSKDIEGIYSLVDGYDLIVIYANDTVENISRYEYGFIDKNFGGEVVLTIQNDTLKEVRTYRKF
jgi:hypothetical protein